MYIIDTNTSCLGKGAMLKSNGVTAVGRYYRQQTHPEYKISKKEAQELSKHGIEIFVVFEDFSHAADLVLTEQQGYADATSALSQAGVIEQPQGSAIYFAVEGLDDGYSSADLPAIRKYFKGVQSVLGGKYAIGVYGNGVVCSTLLKEAVVKYTWLSAASTSFEGTCAIFGKKLWDLAQVPPLDFDWYGLSIDRNIDNPKRNDADFGSFMVTPAIS